MIQTKGIRDGLSDARKSLSGKVGETLGYLGSGVSVAATQHPSRGWNPLGSFVSVNAEASGGSDEWQSRSRQSSTEKTLMARS
ncbi:hypothetical protein HYQ45_010459 [Verticillium longisporum]|uniref:Uncharacterized protein n=1 Tax=Verticillium longisporum TaxID=100787 RepID=A0A8I3ANU1_VERLO|nr:hypothetical protein HYQ45_010459 [Verticillium longisporum]